MTLQEFGVFFDKAGLPLSATQKESLYKVWPMLQTMIGKATAPLPREAEPSVMFHPEVKQ
jgi:hypothetical protein